MVYSCHSCVLRMYRPGFVPGDRDPDYDKQNEGIECCRYS